MAEHHRAVDPRPDFPRLEEEVLARWRERDVFHESIRRREGAPAWVFYEGPPTANGRPGSHHVLSRVFKDIFPRYKTMCGYSVERKGGWDCHGLPVGEGGALLTWTTTPWTLVSNAAVALDPDLIYVRARLGNGVLVLAEPLVERVLGEDAEVLDRFPGHELERTRYEPPFSFL